MNRPRVLVMGCGGIGGVIAATLSENGHDVVTVTHNPTITDAVNARGFTLRSEDASRCVRGSAYTTIPPGSARFDFIFLVTQPPQVENAARESLPFLKDDGAMVCFQNGLCEPYIAGVAGADRTVGAIVAWGGSMPSPGVYDRTSAGGFVIGRLDGRDDARLAALQTLLEPIGQVDRTHNLAGARWSKLAINCAISSLGTIGGQRLGDLIRYRFVRRLGLEIMTEAVVVAQNESVDLEKVAGTIDLDWVALTPADVNGPGSPSLMGKHALLLAVGARFRRLRSSMLVAIERGREPAVDFLNGEVIRRAEPAGLLTPLNRRVRDLIFGIARKTHRPGVPLLRQLYRDSRAEVYAATTSGYRADARQTAAS